MAKGLSNRGSGRRSPGKNKQVPPDLLKNTPDVESFDADLDGAEEMDDVPVTVVPDLAAPEELEAQEEAADEVRKEHPLRVIEARLEAKRLQALLREVYDEIEDLPAEDGE